LYADVLQVLYEETEALYVIRIREWCRKKPEETAENHYNRLDGMQQSLQALQAQAVGVTQRIHAEWRRNAAKQVQRMMAQYKGQIFLKCDQGAATSVSKQETPHGAQGVAKEVAPATRFHPYARASPLSDKAKGKQSVPETGSEAMIRVLRDVSPARAEETLQKRAERKLGAGATHLWDAKWFMTECAQQKEGKLSAEEGEQFFRTALLWAEKDLREAVRMQLVQFLQEQGKLRSNQDCSRSKISDEMLLDLRVQCEKQQSYAAAADLGPEQPYDSEDSEDSENFDDSDKAESAQISKLPVAITLCELKNVLQNCTTCGHIDTSPLDSTLEVNDDCEDMLKDMFLQLLQTLCDKCVQSWMAKIEETITQKVPEAEREASESPPGPGGSWRRS